MTVSVEHGEGRCGSSACPALLALTGFSTPGGHGAGASSTGGAGGTGGGPPLTDFSFFVTNMAAIDDSVGAGGGYGGFYRFAGMR